MRSSVKQATFNARTHGLELDSFIYSGDITHPFVRFSPPPTQSTHPICMDSGEARDPLKSMAMLAYL